MREYYVFYGVEYSCVLLHLFDSCFVATLTGGIYYIQSLHAIPPSFQRVRVLYLIRVKLLHSLLSIRYISYPDGRPLIVY